VSDAARVPVSGDQVEAVLRRIMNNLVARAEKHGSLSYLSPHHTFGVLAEEYDETLEALRANDDESFAAELDDLAVVAIFGVASLIAQGRLGGGASS